jgi:hypothetical protein
MTECMAHVSGLKASKNTDVTERSRHGKGGG